MGLAPVFCCPRTEACLRGTEPELTCIRPLRTSGDSGGTDRILPPVRGHGVLREEDLTSARTLIVTLEVALLPLSFCGEMKMKGPDGEQGVGLRV